VIQPLIFKKYYMTFGFIRKNRLKKEIFNQFVKAKEDNDWVKIDILSQRYIRLCGVKDKIIK
jgi:hypothetical protein